MGVFDVLSGIVSSLAGSAARQRADFSRKYERENPNMSNAQREKLNEFNRMTEKMAELGNTSVS